MKARAARLLRAGARAAFAGSLAALLSAAAALWAAPAVLLRAALGAAAPRFGYDVGVRKVTGNPLSGYRAEGIHAAGPGVRLDAGAVSARLRWRDLFRKKLSAASIVVDGPVLRIDPEGLRRPASAPEGAGAAGPAAGPILPWGAPDVALRRGTARVEGPPDQPATVATRIEADLSFSPDRISLRSWGLRTNGYDLQGAGEAEFNPLRWSARATAAGDVRCAASLRGTPEGWTVESSGAWRNITARLQAQGRGVRPETMEGTARLSVRTAEGAAANWTAEIRKGRAQWQGSVQGGGFSGGGRGSWRWSGRRLDARVRLAAEGKALAPWAPVEASKMEAAAAASGPWPRLSWNLSAAYDGLSAPGFSSGKGRLKASGRGFPPARLDAEASAENTAGRGKTVEEARVRVDGSQASHRFSLGGKGGGVAFSAAGEGRLSGRRWDARWTSLDVRWLQAWRSTAPFTTSAWPGGVRVNGFSLAGERGDLLRLDGVFRADGSFSAAFRAEGLALDPLHEHGWVKDPLSGRVFVDGAVEGTAARPRGAVAFRAEELAFKNVSLGGLRGRLRLAGDSFLWEGVELRSEGGAVTAAASHPWPIPGWPADFRLNLKTAGYDLLPAIKGLMPKASGTASLTADLRIEERKGRLSVTGPARLSGEKLQLPAWGMNLKRADLLLEGDGRKLSVKEGLAEEKKKGSLRLSGAAGLDGPDFSATADNFSFRAGLLSGRTDADLRLAGTWSRPVLSGVVRPREVDVQPEQKSLLPKMKKKEEKKPAAPAAVFASLPFGLDVALRASKNVWYKSNDTAVEFRADLKAEKEPDGPIRLIGDVETVRGDYFLYGRRFEIRQGAVRFAGEDPPDPSITLQAEHKAPEIDALLTVAGTLRRPEISLTSVPPMEEADILSVLATGRPVEDLGAAGTGSDQKATEAAAQGLVAGYLSQQLGQRLQQWLPFNVVRVDMQEGGEGGVTLGKNVNERLYISLEETLGIDGGRRVRTEYTLTKLLSLEGYSNNHGQYVIDLLFKKGYK